MKGLILKEVWTSFFGSGCHYKGILAIFSEKLNLDTVQKIELDVISEFDISQLYFPIRHRNGN